MKITQITILMALSATLISSCSTLRNHDDDAAPILPAKVLNNSEGEPVGFPLHKTLKLSGPETNLAGMSFFEIEVKAGSAGAPPHTHSHEDEFFYVRKGTVTFMNGDERKTIGAGGFALLPRGGLHAFWNGSGEDATLLLGTSEGEFGDFFDAVAMAVREEQASTPQEVGAILGRIAAARGIIIEMDKVPEDVAKLYGLPAK